MGRTSGHLRASASGADRPTPFTSEEKTRMTANHIAMFARGHVRPDRKQEVVDLLRERVKLTESESGTLVHVCHFEIDNPNVFWEYFVFENRDALKIHREFHAKME